MYSMAWLFRLIGECATPNGCMNLNIILYCMFAAFGSVRTCVLIYTWGSNERERNRRGKKQMARNDSQNTKENMMKKCVLLPYLSARRQQKKYSQKTKNICVRAVFALAVLSSCSMPLFSAEFYTCFFLEFILLPYFKIGLGFFHQLLVCAEFPNVEEKTMSIMKENSWFDQFFLRKYNVLHTSLSRFMFSIPQWNAQDAMCNSKTLPRHG